MTALMLENGLKDPAYRDAVLEGSEA